MILYVQTAPDYAIEELRDVFAAQKRDIVFAVIVDSKRKKKFTDKLNDRFDLVIKAKLNSHSDIRKALKPYENRLLAVTCRSEAHMGSFKKIIPNVPYLRTPTADSVAWAIDKTQMRRRFSAYDKSITPKYTLVSDSGIESIKKIERKINYPCVVKPAGLAQSLLVTICYHRDELESTLRKTFRKIKKHYRERKLDDEAKVLVEEFMEGDMYSIDSYVSSRGKVFHCPVVAVKTGQDIGIDDFFNYFQITPTTLSASTLKALKETAEKGIHALGLRSTTAHTELMRTETGWKIIEIGARIGGFRHKFYEMSFGINHSLNDVLIRIPEKLQIPRRRKGYSAVLKYYPKKEGRIKKMKGVKKIREIDSFVSIDINKKIGDMVRFSKHGGKSVFNVILFNKSRSKLLADKRRIEKMVEIVTGK